MLLILTEIRPLRKVRLGSALSRVAFRVPVADPQVAQAHLARPRRSRGYLSPYFVTNADKMRGAFEIRIVILLSLRLHSAETLWFRRAGSDEGKRSCLH